MDTTFNEIMNATFSVRKCPSCKCIYTYVRIQNYNTMCEDCFDREFAKVCDMF